MRIARLYDCPGCQAAVWLVLRLGHSVVCAECLSPVELKVTQNGGQASTNDELFPPACDEVDDE